MSDISSVVRALGGYWKNGQGQAPCPICQPEQRPDQNALSFNIKEGKLLLHCFKSGCEFTDLLDVLQFSEPETCENLKPRWCEVGAPSFTASDNVKRARAIWRNARPIKGTLAESYLRNRGITCDLPSSLRFMPNLFHAPSAQHLPAMVANVQPVGGLHRTFLNGQGGRLVCSAKMMLGSCAGGAVRLSDGRDKLVVCEGIETGLSLMSGMLSGSSVVWSCLSTSGMKSLRLPQGFRKLVIATDGDPAGGNAGQVLMRRAMALGWEVSILPAPCGKDWNDVLMLRGGAQ
ncbi:toprim domain-containing protein [Rhodobacteraceae bacterium MYP1-1]|uniref:Toprim domain-containing protein n=2 Tax=Halocynthiibacter styelae TaxID=2761955 RepID=A0A8J7LLM7_9RHOB|nr:toprim domain-containing protein [Paenihalocynthiibacter styelae]